MRFFLEVVVGCTLNTIFFSKHSVFCYITQLVIKLQHILSYRISCRSFWIKNGLYTIFRCWDISKTVLETPLLTCLTCADLSRPILICPDLIITTGDPRVLGSGVKYLPTILIIRRTVNINDDMLLLVGMDLPWHVLKRTCHRTKVQHFITQRLNILELMFVFKNIFSYFC